LAVVTSVLHYGRQLLAHTRDTDQQPR
jgi:hypothetical protein